MQYGEKQRFNYMNASTKFNQTHIIYVIYLIIYSAVIVKL